MKSKLAFFTVALALAASGVQMASQPWVTNRIAEAEARIIGQIPSTDLTPATNYTDSAIAGLAGEYLSTTGGVVDGKTEFNFLNAGITRLDELTVTPGDTSVQALNVSGGLTASGNVTIGAAVSATEAYLGDTYISGVLSINDEQLNLNTLITTDNIGEYAPQPDLSSYATKSALATVSNEAALVTRLFTSSNVILEVTNYNSVANWPKIRILQLNESNEYIEVWTEMNGLTRTANEAAAYTVSATNALAQQSAAAFAPKAWSGVTSGMGVEAPAGTTWLSTPTTVIAGGYEPEKWITSGGAVWLITSKGATYDFSPSTNNTAYLNISASDGTPMFRIEKTDSYLLPVHADAVSVDGSTLVVDFDLVSSTQPYARVCTDLTTHNWAKEEDGIPAALSTVTWTQTSGGWRCRLSNNTGGNSLFGYFEYLQEGGTKIINEAVMDVGQGILCTDGVHKVRPVYNNGTITWEVVP